MYSPFLSELSFHSSTVACVAHVTCKSTFRAFILLYVCSDVIIIIKARQNWQNELLVKTKAIQRGLKLAYVLIYLRIYRKLDKQIVFL